jgi:hypothetical protein
VTTKQTVQHHALLVHAPTVAEAYLLAKEMVKNGEACASTVTFDSVEIKIVPQRTGHVERRDEQLP